MMVKTPDRTFVIEVKARLLSRGDVRRAAARLAEVRQSLGADHAFLVVPSAIPASVDVDSSVSIVTVPELLETVIQVATR